MARVTYYGHVAQTSLVKLDTVVQEHIEKGWQPYGEMQIVSTQTDQMFIQTLVEYDHEVDAQAAEEAEQSTEAARRHLDMSTSQSDGRPPGCPPGADPE